MGFVAGSIRDTLVQELSNDIGNSKSTRVIIPLCHIYLEHMMTLLLEKKYDESDKFLADTNNSFKKKLEKLNELGLLSDDEYNDLDLINQTRNDFVHTFKPDLEVVQERIFQLKHHVFNEKTNPVKAILYDIIELMLFLEQKIMN